MTPLTCEQVEQQLELFVLDEVSEPERSAVRAHLARCSACSHALVEAQQLLGLLDLHYREADQLARLRQRIDSVDRRQVLPFRVPRFSRQIASLAAMLLLAVALAVPTGESVRSRNEGAIREAMPSRAVPAPPFVRGSKSETFLDPLVLSDGTVIRPSTEARWQRLTGNQVMLKVGALHVRVGPLGVQPVTVFTPSGRITALSADFIVTVRPEGDSVTTNSGSVRQYNNP